MEQEYQLAARVGKKRDERACCRHLLVFSIGRMGPRGLLEASRENRAEGPRWWGWGVGGGGSWSLGRFRGVRFGARPEAHLAACFGVPAFKGWTNSGISSTPPGAG